MNNFNNLRFVECKTSTGDSYFIYPENYNSLELIVNMAGWTLEKNYPPGTKVYLHAHYEATDVGDWWTGKLKTTYPIEYLVGGLTSDDCRRFVEEIEEEDD